MRNVCKYKFGRIVCQEMHNQRVEHELDWLICAVQPDLHGKILMRAARSGRSARIGGRQAEREAAALVNFRFDMNARPVPFQDEPHDGEANAHAAVTLC